eukprot:TRINITY_DN5743_c0_g1_i1.p1 TRINITY_DN5743_c0_g1~~TRINITY_DN5743_c0_g1_i1.p1  ORF type:complete len:229 (+),score=39.91 TRINITY_DN5743_c0_g1_i1:371-1057(+)
MGVKWVLYWQQKVGGPALTNQTYADIVKLVEGLAGTSGTNKWQATCSLQRPIPREGALSGAAAHSSFVPPQLFGVSFSDWPTQHFLVNKSERHVLAAGSEIVVIMDKLQMYRARISVAYEGLAYPLGDFSLRVGKAVLQTTDMLRGIVAELECCGTPSIDGSSDLAQEFANTLNSLVEDHPTPALVGRFALVEPRFSEFGLSDEHGRAHSAVQFSSITTHILSAAIRA